MRSRLIALALAAATSLLLAGPAAASLGPTVQIAGAGVTDLGDTALASDGTGGVVYRAVDPTDGLRHIYVARFSYGYWSAPQRVDVGQQFESQWPRIGAATRGRLVVTWTQPTYFNHERMFSATIGRGARTFGPPRLVDDDIRSAAGNTFPDLAVNDAGEGLLVYKVVTAISAPNTIAFPPGYLLSEIRMARYDGTRWSVLGSKVNRNLSAPMLFPTEDNAPRVAIDETGNGMVAWQEPDDRFVNRIWARRVFGTRLGNQLLASPQSYDGSPLNGPADRPDVAVTRDSGAVVAFRQQAGQRSKLPGTRIFTNRIGDVFDLGGGAFAGAQRQLAPRSGRIGGPSVAIGYDGDGLLAYGQGVTALATNTDVDGASGPVAGIGGATAAPDPIAALGQNGYGAVAWREAGNVMVQERRDGQSAGTRALSASGGGGIEDLALGGNTLGDALVAFRQAGAGGDRVAAALVDSPPQSFGLVLPDSWQRSAKPRIRWERPTDAFFLRRYTIYVDGRAVRITGQNAATLTPRQLPDGARRRIRVAATDRSGQTLYTSVDTLRVDRRPPRVRLRRAPGGRLRVTIADAVSRPKRRGSRIEWGDHTVGHASASATHRYSGRRRRVRVVVIGVDGAGNRHTLRRSVVVGR